MLLFTRSITPQGPPTEVLPWALEITGHVNEHTEMDVSLWSSMFGRALGTLSWSTAVDSLTELEANFDHLQADAGYLSLVERAQPFAGPLAGEDALRRILHMTVVDRPQPTIGSYAELTTAIPAPGKMAQAMAFGVEIADLHTSITDAGIGFMTDAYGDFGRLTWMALYQSAADVDAAAEATMKDADYGTKIDEAGDLFEPGSSIRVLARRIG